MRDVLKNASQLFNASEIDVAIEKMASQIASNLGDRNPILLPVMNGGLQLTGALLRHLNFPLQLDYMHLTRYRDTTSGGDIQWIYQPRLNLAGRYVLIIDDLLDHGVTLNEAVNFCIGQGALAVSTAVLIVKEIRDRPGLSTVDYHAFITPDRYLFGFGMDYKSYWRNAPGIFAI